MYELLKEVLVNDLQMKAADITPTVSSASVGLDSLAAVELSGVLMNRFGVVIHDYELLDLTIGDIAREVQERVRSGPSRPGANPSSQ